MKTSDYYHGLTKLWWLPLVSGIIFAGLGVWCLCDPGPFLSILAYIFAGAIGAVGIFNLFYGICNYNTTVGWGWAVAGGIVEILFSIFLFFIPDPILAYVFVYGTGLYIIFMAIYSFFENFMAIRNNGFWCVLLSLLLLCALAFAFIFILGPGAPGLIGWIWIGVSFLCYGFYRILLATRIKALNDDYRNGKA